MEHETVAEEESNENTVCAFKMVDGTTLFSEHAEIMPDIVQFQAKKTWILVNKTNEKNETTVAVFSCTEMTLAPSFITVPMSSIVLMSDIAEEIRQKIKRATFGIVMPYDKEREGIKL